MFFVSGITGKVGGAAATALLEKGKAVRTLVRDAQRAAGWAQKGVEVREGDLADAAALESPLEGVEGTFIMQPTPMAVTADFPEAKGLTASIKGALSKSSLPRLVVLSSVGSEKTSGLGNITQTHLLEAALVDIPIPTAIVRAGSFLENYAFGLERADRLLRQLPAANRPCCSHGRIAGDREGSRSLACL